MCRPRLSVGSEAGASPRLCHLLCPLTGGWFGGLTTPTPEDLFVLATTVTSSL